MGLFERIKSIPAGLVIIPVAIGALINTFCPHILDIGDPTNILFTKRGMLAFTGMLLFFTGTQLKLSEIKKLAKRGLPFWLFKIALTYLIGFLFIKIFGLNGLWGISALAFCASMASCNAVLFLGIIQPYADSVDYGLFTFMMLFSMPVMPVLFLSSAGGGSINWLSIISVLVPFFFGLLIGNSDEKFRSYFSQGTNVVMPLTGFQFGSCLDLRYAVFEIPRGLLLTVVFYLLSLAPMFFFDRKILKRPGYCGLASCSVAGITLSIPVLVSEGTSLYAPYVDSAMSQIAIIMFITTFVTPFLTHFVAEKLKVSKNS